MPGIRKGQRIADGIRLANEQLAGYAWAVDEHGVFYKPAKGIGPDGNTECVIADYKQGRFQIRLATTGKLLWSGASVENFVKDFWYAQRQGT
jgi:hypothetical protein